MEENKNIETEDVKNDAPKPGTKAYVEAELEATKAELEALKAKNATAALGTGVAAATKSNDRVELFVPREPGNTDPNLLIVINGKNYVLPKGKTSLVPKSVYEEYERMKRAQYKVDNAIYEMVEKAKKEAKEAGIK